MMSETIDESRSVHSARSSLRLREEALHRRIIPDVAGTAHRTDDAVISHQPLELSRTCFKGLSAHQSLDPVQSARYAVSEEIVPHAPGAIGPVAPKEAGTDLRAEILVTLDALAAWPCQPRIKPTSRDTERFAQPTRRPDPPVLRDETELHVDSFAK